MYRRYGFSATQTLDMAMTEFDAWLEALCDEEAAHDSGEPITGRMNGGEFSQSGSWESIGPG
jgi:hypothetical protein